MLRRAIDRHEVGEEDVAAGTKPRIVLVFRADRDPGGQW